MGRITARLLVMLLAFAASGPAYGEVKLNVELGWGGRIRPGGWSPIFVTVSSPEPRNVLLELITPTDYGNAMRIRQSVAAGPEPATYPLLAPLTYNFAETVLNVRDLRSGKRLADYLFDDPMRPDPGLPPMFLHDSQHLLGVSGRSSTMQLLERQVEQQVAVGFLEPRRLPAVAEGYTALDTLALNQPNLDPSGGDPRAIRAEQQQAIVDWVKAGGNLILWLGDDPLPPSSPIVAALPCQVGDVEPLEIAPEVLRKHGLPARFRQTRNRPLAPIGGAQSFPLLDGDSGATGCEGRLGFGRILVLSMDVSMLQFDNPGDALDFWQPILHRVVDPVDPQATTRPYYHHNTLPMRASRAMHGTMDLIGDIPGVGSFGFSYVVMVLIAMMLVVGPIDWFILRKLGRQPWTWVTTAGWIVLVTTGAIYVGHVFKSGDLHLRTLRLVDQADGETVATSDVICVYSPRTREYDVQVDEQAWFRPPSTSEYYFGGSRGLRSETTYRQDYRGNRPEEMRINVWNLRFLQGQNINPRPQPMLDAALTRTPDGKLRGTIANLSEHALERVVVLLDDGQFAVQQAIPALGSINVDGPIDVLKTEPENANDMYYYGPTRGLSQPTDPAYSVVALLSVPRARQIERMMNDREPVACVYAECASPPVVADLAEPEAIEKHRQIIRALVRLNPPGEEKP